MWFCGFIRSYLKYHFCLTVIHEFLNHESLYTPLINMESHPSFLASGHLFSTFLTWIPSSTTFYYALINNKLHHSLHLDIMFWWQINKQRFLRKEVGDNVVSFICYGETYSNRQTKNLAEKWNGKRARFP